MLDDRTHIDLYPGGLSRQFVPFAQPNSHFPDQKGVYPGIAMMLKDAGIDTETFEGTAKDTRAALAFAKRERAARLRLVYNKFGDAPLTDSTIFGVYPNVEIRCHPGAVLLHRFLPHSPTPTPFTNNTIHM